MFLILSHDLIILQRMIHKSDILIIGAGLAGSVAALDLADHGFQVTLIASGNDIKASNSFHAQGGIVYPQNHPEDLKDDILKAGSGLCYEKAIDQLIEVGEEAVRETLIERFSVPFEKKFTLEAAHSKARILYYQDQTGKAIMETILERLNSHPFITLKFCHYAVDLITLSHHSKTLTDIYAPPTCIGAYVFSDHKHQVEICFAKETLLATGGIGEVFLHTTNTKEARGDGIAMAYRAGVRIMNMEYVQFHPTSFYRVGEPRFLLSEALRGEGAKLLTHDFLPFMHRVHEDEELAPRDVVARGIFQEMIQSNAPHLWLDISFKKSDLLKDRFPHIYRHCKVKGFDLTAEPIPVVPAAHYSCGGIAVDLEGRTSMRNLRAIGEVSCTGVHGANRLASTSLLESLVWAKTTARGMIKSLKGHKPYFPEVEPWRHGLEKVDPALIQQDWLTIKQTMWNYVGLIRSTRRLERALKMLTDLKWEIDSFYANASLTPELLGLRNGCETALLITKGALRNRTSLGCHYREEEACAEIPAHVRF